MTKKTYLFSLEKLDRMIKLYGALKIITSEVLYYHYAGEYDELIKEHYAEQGRDIPSSVAVF